MNSFVKLFYSLINVFALVVATKQPTLPIGECVVQILPRSNDVETSSFSFRCQLAAFGAYLSEENEGVKVMLAPGDKMLSCSSFSENSEELSGFEGAAMLVRRGECSFQEKLAYVAATGAALMILVNSEDALIPLSSLEYEHSSAAAVSVTQSDGEKLIQLVKKAQYQQLEIEVKTMSLVSQARARLQFLVGINALVSVYEEYLDVAEDFVGTLDELLSRIMTKISVNLDAIQGESNANKLVKFFSWNAQMLTKWSFASEAALHASIAAAVLQIQLRPNENQASSLIVRTTAQKLAERGYYTHSASLLRTLLTSSTQPDKSVQCLLSFLKFLRGDVITSWSCQVDASIPSLKVAQEAFNRLIKLNTSTHDEECLRLAAGSLNDTIFAATCCYMVEEAQGHTGSLSRKFSSEFTKELFHSLVMMGVFLDESGSFDESLRFFSYAAQLCQGDKTTLQLRQLLAVPIVFSSQKEMDLFIAELRTKLHTFTGTTTTKKQNVNERVVSPLGSADRLSGAVTDPVLRPENAAYLQYTITPSTMFIGYQGINVLSIQRAINQLRTSVYPSLSSSFEPLKSEEHLCGSNHKLRRVGFISTWFRMHSVGKLMLGVVQNLDRTKFHVSIYHCVHFLRDSDEIMEAFKLSADEFVELPESQDEAVQMLRQAQLDVIVYPELGMDEWTVLLSHHRVAPIQCVFWGHPITTGNPNIDYFISSEHFVSKNFDKPVDEDVKLSGYRRSSFSEQIVLFRGLSTIFTEPKPLSTESEGITRSRLHLPTNRRLYVCPQTLMKLHPAFDEALANILERDDKATIVLLASDTQIVWMEQLRRRFRQRFGRNYRRVLFLPTLPFAEFQALLALADVVLDPFPFGGGVTTLDALHLGIPVVTLPATQSVVHLAAGFLRYMNASDCIAETLEDYVQLAVNIAMNHEGIRQRLLSHRSDIYQDVSTIEDWNKFLETVIPRTT